MSSVQLGQHNSERRAGCRVLSLFKPGSASLILLCLLALPPLLRAGWNYASPEEFFAAGDFDGDGRQDVAVLDRATGNVRIGYQSTANTLVWGTPRSTGISDVSGFTTGRLIQSGRDAVAVTSPDANRIALLDCSVPNGKTPPLTGFAVGVGPNTLSTLAAPFGAFTGLFDYLAVSSARDGEDLGQRLDIMVASAGELSLGHSVTLPQTLERLNGFQFASAGPTFLGGISRSNTDSFYLFQFTNTLLEPFVLPGLPPGSDFLFGRFVGGYRFLFYQPGTVSGLEIHVGDPAASDVLVTPGTALTPFGQVVRRMEYLTNGISGSLLVLFDDGQSAKLYDINASNQLVEKQTLLAASGESLTGLVPLGSGQFAVLSGTGGSTSSTRFHFYRATGSQFVESASGDLPAISVSSTRATVLLFDREPFVASQPAYVGSFAGGDWVTGVSSLPASITVTAETDRGSASGLGNPSSKSLGAAPSAARFGLPNQYHPAISFFSLKSASGAEPISVGVTPPAGRYSGPVTLTLRATTAGDTIYYRLGSSGSWIVYGAPITITETSDLNCYAENGGTGARSRLVTASYQLPTISQPLTPGGGTNYPPIAGAAAWQRLLVKRPTTVSLDGTPSRDPEGGRLAFVWVQTRGPKVTLSGANTATPSFVTPGFSNVVILRFHLTVYDDRQASDSIDTAMVLDDGCTPIPEEPATLGFNPDGSFSGSLKWPGLPGDEVVVQVSEDLANWQDLGIGNVGLLSLVFFTDLSAGIYEHRFYRAIER